MESSFYGTMSPIMSALAEGMKKFAREYTLAGPNWSLHFSTRQYTYSTCLVVRLEGEVWPAVPYYPRAVQSKVASYEWEVALGGYGVADESSPRLEIWDDGNTKRHSYDPAEIAETILGDIRRILESYS